MLNIHLGLLFIFKTSPRHSSAAAGFSFFDSPRRREAAIVHCQISLIEINASSSLPHVFCSVAATRPPLGGEAMATAADYRKWAEECFEWARQASDESVSEQYASLGRVWLEYAARAELQSGAITSSDPKVA